MPRYGLTHCLLGISIPHMKEIYAKNPKLHLQELYAFRHRVKNMILGEEDNEWRRQLEFVIERTDEKINEVKFKVYLIRYN